MQAKGMRLVNISFISRPSLTPVFDHYSMYTVSDQEIAPTNQKTEKKKQNNLLVKTGGEKGFGTWSK